MRLSTLNTALFCLGCYCLTAIGTARAGELEDALFDACDRQTPHYEYAAAMLALGADPDAVSPTGETVMQLLLLNRREDSEHRAYDANAALLTLLLKNDASLPDVPPADNPARLAAAQNDQTIWDLLCLKYGESTIGEYAGRALDWRPEWKLPEDKPPEELTAMLFSACDGRGGYDVAAWLVAAGADVNAVSAEGETVFRYWLRHRHANFFRGENLNDLAILALLLKNGAEPPAAGEEKNNPVRNVVEMLDQGAWDILRLKYSEARLVGSGGWPVEPAKELTVADRTLKVPPPAGHVPYNGDGLNGLSRLALRAGYVPAASALFVPEAQANSPTEKITAVAAVFERSDVSYLKGEERHRALSRSDELHGGLYTFFFENAEFTVAFSGEPAPWAAEQKLSDETRGMVVLMNDSLGLGGGRPYQLVLYLSGGERPESEEGLVRACGLLAAWRLALRQANDSAGAP